MTNVSKMEKNVYYFSMNQFLTKLKFHLVSSERVDQFCILFGLGHFGLAKSVKGISHYVIKKVIVEVDAKREKNSHLYPAVAQGAAVNG